MAYPDNLLETDQLEPDQYGGANPDNFDARAWTWITGLVRSISKVVLAGVRVPYSSAVAIVQESIQPGDVLAVDLSVDAIDGATQLRIPWVGKYTTVVANAGIPKILGVSVVTAAPLVKAQFATGGLLAQAITGLTSMTGGIQVGVNPSTNKLRTWQAGDETLGYSSPNGNVLLAFAGRLV